MSDDLEEFIQAQKVKLAHARKTHGIKSPEIQVPKLATNAQPPRTAGYFGSNPQGAPEPDYFTAPPAVSNQFPPGRDEGLKLGEYDEKKRLYREQRKAETRDFFAKDKRQSRKPTRDAPPVAQNRGTSMPFQDDVVAKRQKEFERNREYNEFLSNKVGMGQPRTRPTEEIPGSFFPDPDKENEARLRNERNREYNDYLRRKQEHERLKKAGGNVDESAGGVTSDAKPIVYQPVYHEGQNAPRYVMPAVAPPAQMPNYEEMLRQKAEEERKYRAFSGLNDSLSPRNQLPDFRQPPPAVSMAPQFVPQYMVPQQSLGGYQQPGPQSQGQRVRRLPPVEDLEARMQTYDFELGKRKQMLKEDHRNSNLNISLNQYSSDPSLNMLESGKYMNGDMFLDEQLMGHFGKMREDPPMRFDDMPSANYGAPPPQMQQMAAPNRLTEGGGGGFSGPSGSIAPPSGPAPGGPPDPQYEKKKKQQEYKKALVAQMHAQEAARKIEKEKNLQINLTGDKDASKLQMGYMRSGGGVGEYPFPQQQQQQQQRPPGVSKLPLDGSNQLISRPLDLWSTGNAAAPSFDATYNYFANADPLDPMVAPRGLLGLDVSRNSQGSVRKSKNDFDTTETGGGFYSHFDFGKDKKANANAGGSQAYQAELLKQMREKQDKEYRQKLEHERWEKKKDAEDSYFPFGKGGAGAPLRDADGNIIADIRSKNREKVHLPTPRKDNKGGDSESKKVDCSGESADLRELHHIAETNKQPSVKNEYHGQLTETLSARPNEHYSGAPVSSRDPAAPQFARGKIFNDPIPKHQLTQQEQYKLDLKRQMEEKQNEKDLARKKQAEEDEKEEARIREQMSQIQAEYEKEQEKIRMKAEEQQKKNEEMRQEAEQKRLALERARKEEEEKRSEERRKDMERELEERRRAEQAKKPASPPLPAQKKTAPVPVQDPRPAPQSKTVTPAAPGGGAKSVNIPSHPVRLVKGKTTGRDQSRAEVNRQLSAMRQQLMSEQRRIEMQIENKNALGANEVQYPLDVKSIDAELFQRELDTEKEQRSKNTGGREFPIPISSASARHLPPLDPSYHIESTSSSLVDDNNVTSSLALAGPSSVGIVPKNANHSSSTPVYSQPRKSTTPRRGPQGGSRLFSRTKSLPPTAVPFEENNEQMPHILEEFDLSPKETSAPKAGVEKKDQSTTTNENGDRKPQAEEFNVYLLNPPEISRPDSENLVEETENCNLPTPRRTSSPKEGPVGPEDSEERSDLVISATESANPKADSDKPLEPSDQKQDLEIPRSPSVNELRDIVQDVTHKLSNLSVDPEEDKISEVNKENQPLIQTDNQQNQSSNTGPVSTEANHPDTLQENVSENYRPNTVSETTLVLKENSDHGNLINNENNMNDETNTANNGDMNTTKSTVLPNFGNDTTIAESDVEPVEETTADNSVIQPPLLDDSKLSNTDTYARDQSNDATNQASNLDSEFPSLAQPRVGILKTPSNSILKKDSTSLSDVNSLPGPSSLPDNPQTGEYTPADVERSEGVLRRYDTAAESYGINDRETVGPGSSDNVALGYLAAAQAETDSLKPITARSRKRQMKSVRFFEVIEDDPYRPEELRDFAIPINNKMPPRLKTVPHGAEAAVFEDVRGHGPYPDSARLAYISAKLDDEMYRESLLSRGQAILPGPDENAMITSLLIDKPTWTENSNFDSAGTRDSKPRERPWVDSFSKKEVEKIEQKFSGNDFYRLADGPKPDKKRVDAVFDKNIKGPNDVDHYGFSKHDVRPPRQPSTDMILTEPAKVRRPTQLESWNPIFKDEPNEAALDLFLHSKYDPLTRSRDNFRQQFPNAPRSSDMLEVQQQELIRQQERELLRLRKGDPGSDLAEIREDDLNFLIDHPDAKSMPLASDSAYIGLKQIQMDLMMHGLDSLRDSPDSTSLNLVADTAFIGINGDTLIPTPPLMTKIERMRDRRRMEPEKPATPPDNTNGPKLKDFLPSPPSSAGGPIKPKISHQLSNNVSEIPDVEDVNLPFEPFQVERSFAKNDDAEKQLPNPDTLSLGSNFSFDVDAVARKNKERLRKLENSNDVDTLSIADPDEVLRKFVDHDLNPKAVRPMSTMTNDTDPDWLKPS